MSTLTVYPTSSNVDGTSVFDANPGTWADARDAATGGNADTQPASQLCFMAFKISATRFIIRRGFFLFDTSPLTSDATISAGVFSLAATGSTFTNADSSSVDLIITTPAAPTAITTADYDQVGTTLQATSIALSAWVNVDGTYNDFTLNGTGLGNVSKTGITYFGTRSSLDTSNTEPTGANRADVYFSGTAETDKDPKLVITYTIPSGPANLKTYNTNLSANIKTINTNLIANVKSLNTNV